VHLGKENRPIHAKISGWYGKSKMTIIQRPSSIQGGL